MTDQPTAAEVIAKALFANYRNQTGNAHVGVIESGALHMEANVAAAALEAAHLLRTPGTIEVSGTGLDESVVWEADRFGADASGHWAWVLRKDGAK